MIPPCKGQAGFRRIGCGECAGSSFTGYASTNGASWALIGATHVSGFSSNALWRLAVTAHNHVKFNPATLDNLSLNQSPAVTAISNRTLLAGQTLFITNSATDADVPAQILTWSLLNATTNALLNPASGQFIWRPTMPLSPSTNLMSLSVTENGLPGLAATQSFSVFVSPPASPTISRLTIRSGLFGLTLSGDAGPDYGLFASTNLIDWLQFQQTNSG